MVVDALSRRYALISMLSSKLLGFERLKDCMPMILNLLMCLRRVNMVLLISFTCTMGFFLGENNYAFLYVLCESCLLENHILVG